MQVEVIVQTRNSTYEFEVGNDNTTVRGGIVGGRPVGCLPGRAVIDAALYGDASTLVGQPLRFEINEGGTYSDPRWQPVRTSDVKGAVVRLPLAA